MFESSRARIMPKIVMMIAVVFVSVGMVIGGVFVGGIYDVMSRPAMMLPRASRMRGLVRVWAFSSMGVVVGMRGYSVWTSRVMRRLYVAVNDVARSVMSKAQAFR